MALFKTFIWPILRLACISALVGGVFLWLEEAHQVYVDRHVAVMIGIVETTVTQAPDWVWWVLVGSLGLVGMVGWEFVAWLRRRRSIQKQGNDQRYPPANAQRVSTLKADPDKIDVIKSVYSILNDEMLPAYDRGCYLANQWKQKIQKEGKDLYKNTVLTELLQRTGKIGTKLAKLLEKNELYNDVFKEFSTVANAQNALNTETQNFLQKVNLLPGLAPDETMELVRPDAEKFQKAVGAFGQFIRQKRQKAIEMKKAEESRG